MTSRLIRAISIVGIVCACSMLDGASQEVADPAAILRVEPLDDTKILAQNAALPALSGENPFILRESSWSGSINPGKAKLIQVQLFRRNDYQFWLAVPNRDAKLDLNLYDGEGNLISSEMREHGGGNVVSAVVTPETTGVYYLRISLQTSITDLQEWAVIYAYK